MYEFAREVVGGFGAEDLGAVSCVSRRDFDERTAFTFRAQAPCLEYLSLLIENAVLLRANRAGRVYVTFQKLSHMRPVAERYLRIADLSERLYVFGEPDWKPPRHPNMRLLYTPPQAKLAREWVIIADSSTLRVALVAREDEEQAVAPPAPEQRYFRALKTSAPSHVERLADAAENLVDNFIQA